MAGERVVSSKPRRREATKFTFRRHLDGGFEGELADSYELAWQFAWNAHFEDPWPGWGTEECCLGIGRLICTTGGVHAIRIEDDTGASINDRLRR